MKTKLYLFIAFRIITLFGLAMASTFLPEHLRDFFGDTKYVPTTFRSGDGTIDIAWSWGARHYWFFFMMALLFLLSLVDSVMSVFGLVYKYYPNLK